MLLIEWVYTLKISKRVPGNAYELFRKQISINKELVGQESKIYKYIQEVVLLNKPANIVINAWGKYRVCTSKCIRIITGLLKQKMRKFQKGFCFIREVYWKVFMEKQYYQYLIG